MTSHLPDALVQVPLEAFAAQELAENVVPHCDSLGSREVSLVGNADKRSNVLSWQYLIESLRAHSL